MGELTQKAAEDLRNRWAAAQTCSRWTWILTDWDIAVAFLYGHAFGTFDGDQIVGPRTDTKTQDIGVSDYCFLGNRIRFIACHWTSRIAGRQ